MTSPNPTKGDRFLRWLTMAIMIVAVVGLCLTLVRLAKPCSAEREMTMNATADRSDLIRSLEQRAHDEFVANRFDAAESVCLEVLKLDHTSGCARYVLGLVEKGRGNVTGARYWFTVAHHLGYPLAIRQLNKM